MNNQDNNEWIDIKDKRPAAVNGNKVLGFGNGYAFECEFNDGYWCNLGGETMTHWIPLKHPILTTKGE